MSYTYGTADSRQNSIDNRNWPAVIVSNPLRTPALVDARCVDQFYDHVGAHLRGIARVFNPMIEINNIVINECRHSMSADHRSRGKLTQSDTQLSYYTPQKIKTGETISSSDQRSHCKCAGDTSGRKLTSDNSYNRSTNKSTYKPLSEASYRPVSEASYRPLSESSYRPLSEASYRPLSEASCSTTLSISKKENNYHKDSSQRFSSSTEIQSFQRPQAKSNDFHRDYVSKNCSICGIDIKKVKVLAQIPCKHSFCYPCMSRNELNACPKCSKPLKRENIKNITIQ